MKKITKNDAPDTFKQYAHENPKSNWDDFRNINSGSIYKEVKIKLSGDQHHLCAYCEKKLDPYTPHMQQVEHFHPKSDTIEHNWALDWDNLLMVCNGGQNPHIYNHEQFPLPANLSCDASKNHYINNDKNKLNCEAYLCSPLKIQDNKLFEFNKGNGELIPNRVVDDPKLLCYLNKTIKVLNLNCNRLCSERLLILKSYNQIVAKAIKYNNQNIFKQLAKQWLSAPCKSYFTTRRSLLQRHAEKYISKNGVP